LGRVRIITCGFALGLKGISYVILFLFLSIK